MERTIIIAANKDGFANIEAILRAWDIKFHSSKVDGLWVVEERSSFLSNLFSNWEVKNYQISIWEKIN